MESRSAMAWSMTSRSASKDAKLLSTSDNRESATVEVTGTTTDVGVSSGSVLVDPELHPTITTVNNEAATKL